MLAERVKFWGTNKKPGQALNEYYSTLQAKARDYEFAKVTDVRDMMVGLKFVSGITNVETRKRLLEKENLLSQEALAVAEAFERVSLEAPNLHAGIPAVGVSQLTSRPKGARVIQGGRGREDIKQFPSKTKQFRSVKKSSNLQKPQFCSVCGIRGHNGSNCFIKSQAFCKICRKDGHMAKACKTTRKSKNKVHYSETPDSEEEEYTSSSVKIANILPKTNNKSSSKSGNAQRLKSLKTKKSGHDTVMVPLLSKQKISLPIKRVTWGTETCSFVKKHSVLKKRPVTSMEEPLQLQISTVNESREKGMVEILRIRKEPPVMLPISMKGTIVHCELDTGSAISILDEGSW